MGDDNIREWLIAVTPDVAAAMGTNGIGQTGIRVKAMGMRILEDGTLFLGDVTTKKPDLGDLYIAPGQWSAIKVVG